MTFDNLILPAELKRELQTDFAQFFAARETYERYSIPWKRGALLTVYRAAFFYGTSRWIAWTIWAHVIHHYPYDLSWGGPHWVNAAHP